jgi:hypothetical protein
MFGPLDEVDVLGIRKRISSRIVAHLNFYRILQTVANQWLIRQRLLVLLLLLMF